MITLSDKAVKEYQKIFKKEYKQDLSLEEAREQGTRLVNLFDILMRVERKQQTTKKG